MGQHGISVTWDGYSSATIIAEHEVDSCGLCGSYVSKEDNDVERSWFSGYYNNVVKEEDSASEKIGSWKMDYFTKQVRQQTLTLLLKPLFLRQLATKLDYIYRDLIIFPRVKRSLRIL